MKRLIVAAAVAVGLVCAGSASAAKYETYTTALSFGYQLRALVGHTPAEYAQAQRVAGQSEALRHLALAPQTIFTVAVDDSAGTAQQVRWISPDHTVAVIDIP